MEVKQPHTLTGPFHIVFTSRFSPEKHEPDAVGLFYPLRLRVVSKKHYNFHCVTFLLFCMGRHDITVNAVPHQPVLHGEARNFTDIMQIELFHKAGAVGVDGLDGEVELGGDVFVAVALGDKFQHDAFEQNRLATSVSSF